MMFGDTKENDLKLISPVPFNLLLQLFENLKLDVWLALSFFWTALQ